MLALALLLLSAVGTPPDVLAEHCDLIELNHFHDDAGRLIFDQVIFYDWDPRDCRFVVRDWRMMASGAASAPRWRLGRDHGRDAWTASASDGQALRRVTARCFRESWTQHDPELAEQEILPKERRRGLRSPARAKSIMP